MTRLRPLAAAVRRLLARLRCLRYGHEPGDRDWVGRAVKCARCGRYDAELGWRAREQLYGRAAIRGWNAEAMRRLEEVERG